MKKICIVIPAFRAAAYIESTVTRVKQVFADEAEIIIVVNDPLDNAISVVRRIAAEDENVRFLQFSKKLGKGKAILEGFKIAQANVLGFIDADCPFDLKVLKSELDCFSNSDCDCIIFSKWQGRKFNQVSQPFVRKCMSRVFNLLVRKLVSLDFVDTQGGAKFIRREVLLKLGYDFTCLGFVFDVELIKKLLANNAGIKEVYIPYSKTGVSTVNVFRDLFPVLRSLFRLKRQKDEK